jgi:hypothetical protein
MGGDEKRAGSERRDKKDRRSGLDTRSGEEKGLTGERRTRACTHKFRMSALPPVATEQQTSIYVGEVLESASGDLQATRQLDCSHQTFTSE